MFLKQVKLKRHALLLFGILSAFGFLWSLRSTGTVPNTKISGMSDQEQPVTFQSQNERVNFYQATTPSTTEGAIIQSSRKTDTAQYDNKQISNPDLDDAEQSNDALYANVTSVEHTLDQDQSLCDIPLLPPSLATGGDHWQVVLPEANLSWVYSSHLDPREDDKAVLHIMGMMLTETLYNTSDNYLYCQLWDPVAGLVDIVRGNVASTNLRVRYLYENFVMTCAFAPGLYTYNRTHVSVVRNRCDQPQNAIAITDNRRNAITKVKYTVCICGSMRNNYSDYQRFIEWMEMNSILGVDRTIIYDTDTADYMQRVFRYYVDKGVLESIDWNPPYVFVRKYAHIAMVHDCLMRAMMKTEYVAFIDVDETIAPRRRGILTWDEMIKAAGCEGRSYISAPNSLYHPDWPDDGLFANDSLVAKKWRLYSLLKTKRETEFMGFEDRSKNIMKPENVDHLKLHKVFLRAGVQEKPCFMSHKIGALYHYRWLYTSIQRGREKAPAWIEDKSLHKYRDLLRERVAEAYQSLEEHLPSR